jgi:hypothetical protein
LESGVSDPFRRAIAGFEQNPDIDRQIVWQRPPGEDDDTADPKKPKPKPTPYDYQNWGNRNSDAISEVENAVQGLVDIPELATPQALGINLFRNDQQATLHNSDARARITYNAGRSGKITFDCDWRGVVVVHGTKVTIDYVSFRVNAANPYVRSEKVILAASIGTNAVHASTDPTLTYLPELVAASGVRAIEIPVAARRVSLLMKYSSLPGATGDAPLGATFLSFSDPDGNAMSWIDALNTRSVVFGAGLPIPHGARYLGLSNNDVADTYLGAIFHLGF